MSFNNILTDNPNKKLLNITINDLTVNEINGTPFILPQIGNISIGDIPVSTGNNSPFFVDSNINLINGNLLGINSIKQTDVGNSIIDINDVRISSFDGFGTGIDFNPSVPQSAIIGYFNTEYGMLSTDSNVSILSVNNNLLLSGSNLLLTGNDNNISLNNSTLSIQGGLNKDVSINSNNNISITADEISINASFGINNILNLTASNKINITSNIDMNLSNIYNCSKIENDPNNSLNMTGGSSSLNSINSVTLNQTSSGSFIQLNNARMILATNTFLPIDILTDGDLNIKASASYGSQDMILTRTTGNKCEWVQRPILPLSLFFLGNFLASGSLGATRFLNASGQAMVTSGTQNSTNTIVPFRINPLNYPNIGLKVPKLKLIYTVITNNVLTGSNFTASLYNYTSSGINTGITISAGVIFGSSVNINNPSINSTTVSESVLFNLPVSTNNYVLGINSVGITTSFSYHIVSLEIVYN